MSDSDREHRPIVISGIGCVSPLGLDPGDIPGRCLSGATAIAPMETLEGLSGMAIFGARAPAFDLESYLRQKKSAKFVKRAVGCAVVAAYGAAADSGIDWSAVDPERIGLFTASGQTNVEYDTFFRALEEAWGDSREEDFKYLTQREARLIDRYFSLRTLANGGLALLSLEFGARGCSSNHTQGDAAFAMAVRTAQYDLWDGRCDVALVGAYDCLLTPSTLLAYSEAGLLSAGCYRPFDRRRTGIVLGEGAAFFVLERHGDAARRGANALSSITGIGTIHDCSHTNGIGWQTKDLALALDAASLTAAKFHYAVAHGFGTPEADRSESQAWEYAEPGGLPVTALKGLTGYLGAATAAVELAIGLACSRAGFIPQITGWQSPDPEISLNLLRHEPLAITTKHPAGLFVARSLTGQVSAIGTCDL